jgi:penicillin-binding protein 2
VVSIWSRYAQPAPDLAARRVDHVGWVFALGLIALLGRLAWMQLAKGAEFQELARLNSVRTVPSRAPRGLIFDRNLRPLVSNAPAISAGITPSDLPRDAAQAQAVLEEVARLLKLDPLEVAKKVKRQQQRPFAPARLMADVDRGLAAKLRDRQGQLPGLTVWEDSKRSYGESIAAHVLGYVGEISDHQLERLKAEGYHPNDWLGQAGMESRYDSTLKGKDGGKQVRINARGKELGVLSEFPPQPGENLVLTLDAGLQQVAEEALGQEAGAVVAIDPRNGEVLALVSKPDYPLSTFAGKVKAKEWSELLNDERHPMNNRAVQGLYPPGSVFKLVTAIAALQEGAITPDEKLTCTGIHWISNWPYRCWKEVGHGSIAMEQAITESCDIYFYQLGLKLKVDALARWTREFGFGEPSGIDLPGEAGGLVPDPAWKQAREGLPWFPGNTVMMSIGQGYLLATPLQLAQMVSVVANGGTLIQPHLLKRVTSPEGDTMAEPAYPPQRQLGLEAEALHLVQRGMEGAVANRKGTAWRARVAGVSVAGKTGTAQNPHGEDHAAFVCFAPVESPEIAIAIVVENGGEGGLTAAPIARRMLEHHFRDL